MTLSIQQVIDADVVDRVACPTCHQRLCEDHKFSTPYSVDLECNCCRGWGYVDVDKVFDVAFETLSDCCFGRVSPAPLWLPPGCYTVIGGAYIVLSDRTVDFATDEQIARAYHLAESRKRAHWVSKLIAWVLGEMNL